MHRLLLFLSLAILVISCNNDSYDAGDGKYSYYTAEMATFKPGKDTLIYNGILDDNRSIQLANKIKVGWALPDSTCRMMLYFQKVSETQTSLVANAVGAMPCYIPDIQLADTLKKEVATDPLTVISAWQSKNSEYYNLHFAVKTSGSNRKPQYVGLVCDSISHGNTVHMRLVHNQNGVAEDFSSENFMSISKAKLQALTGHPNPTLLLQINTYNGVKTFDYSQKNIE